MYSVNRPLEYFDEPQVRKVVRDAKADNYTFNSLVLGIVKSDAFRKQGPLSVSKRFPQKPMGPLQKRIPKRHPQRPKKQSR